MRSIINYSDVSHARLFRTNIISVLVALFFIALFFALSFVNLAHANETAPPAPTLISVTQGIEFTNPKPVITGLTFNDTQVDIFIDNQFSGSAIVRNHESGTANFYFYPPLLTTGRHAVHAIARKADSISQNTPEISFRILGTSAPTLFIPVFNLETTELQPFIVGLVHNNSRVKIYINDEYNGEIWVKNHASGVANFAYKPKYNLSVGMHQVRAMAVNRITGQQSGMSSMVTFEVKQPYPAPTLFRPTTSGATWFRPNINGVAKNGSYVEVYVNNVKHRVDLADHPSGTTSFFYQPEQNLRAGMNIIFAVAYSKTNKMSRKSNIIYWDLTPSEEREKEPLAVEEPPVVSEVEPEITEEPAVIEDVFPDEEPEIEIETEDRSEEAEVTIEAEEPEDSPEPVVSGEEDEIEADVQVEGDELEAGTNWSKIIGLIILAILIITLIIQLLKKEEPKEKEGETLKLFEEEEKKKDDDKKDESKSDKDEKPDDNIPPPPPPSSNLPF